MNTASLTSKIGHWLRVYRRESQLGRRIGDTAVRKWARSLYETLVLHHGVHTIQIQGKFIKFTVPTKTVLSRLDGTGREEELLQRLLSHLQPTDLVFDVGANIGLFSLAIASSEILHSPAKVIAFEPEPENFKVLMDSSSLNDLPIIGRHEALGSVVGEMLLHRAGAAGTGTHTLITAQHEPSTLNSIAVPINTIDALKPVLGFPTVLKIDVEGFEEHVLWGAQNALKSNSIRHVFIEVHPAKGVAPESIAEILLKGNMHLVWERKCGNEIHQHYQNKNL